MSSCDPTSTTDAKEPQTEKSRVSSSDDSPSRPDGAGKEGEVSSTEETDQGSPECSTAVDVVTHPVLHWVQQQMENGVQPLDLLTQLLGSQATEQLQDLDQYDLWELLVEIITRPPTRCLLSHVSTVEDVVRLIESCSNIIVLSGAGISVSCGIPDFRSPDGLYAKLSVQFPSLPSPQAMFDINFFRCDPRPFFRFAKEIFPGTFCPSLSHYFVAALESRGKLLRTYTQNIDALEEQAGISRVVYCHGSFSTATCTKCKHRVPIERIKDKIMSEEVPICDQCLGSSDDVAAAGIIKPDIVFFGEGLPEEFHHQIHSDKGKADLLLVIGSSLRVRPVSLIPEVLNPQVPQVLLNREQLMHVAGFDVRLLGYSDDIVATLCHKLGWKDVLGKKHPSPQKSEYTSPSSRIYLFPGAIWPPPLSTTSLSDSDEKTVANTAPLLGKRKLSRSPDIICAQKEPKVD